MEIEEKNEALREKLDLDEEVRSGASLWEASLKQKIAISYDAKIRKRDFEVDNLVLIRNHKDSREGKLAAYWEGPY